MDSFKRFNEEKLPDKKCFYRSVKNGTTDYNGKELDGHINDGDYLTCKKICNKFNMKNMADYPNHYMKKDDLLLADVWETFIDTRFKFYKLDPCHYFSSSGLSWDAMLKMTGVNLKQIIDIDMYLFIEKGLRGGVWYSKVNNNYLQNYHPTKPSKYISYLDMNNLYVWTVSGYLPYGGFKC